MSSSMNDLFKVLHDAKKYPNNMSLLLLDESEYIRVHYGNINFSKSYIDYGIVKNLKLERGQILDIFSKMEFIINELINLKLFGYDLEKKQMMNLILDSLSLQKSIDILFVWEIIDGHTKNKFEHVKTVRNQFAHSWSKNEVFYNRKPIKQTFEQFKDDLLEVWKKLIEIYSEEQKVIDVDKIIQEIKEINK